MGKSKEKKLEGDNQSRKIVTRKSEHEIGTGRLGVGKLEWRNWKSKT